MLQYDNTELKPISDADTLIHDELWKIVKHVDNLIQKKWTEYIYAVQVYDENEWNNFTEVYSDYNKAKKSFIELMKYYFSDDLKDCGNINRDECSEFRYLGFVFTTDCFETYNRQRHDKWDYSKDYKYPDYTWKAYNYDFYTEVVMKKIPVDKSFILHKEETEWTNKN